jgi:hypothetical protein
MVDKTFYLRGSSEKLTLKWVDLLKCAYDLGQSEVENRRRCDLDEVVSWGSSLQSDPLYKQLQDKTPASSLDFSDSDYDQFKKPQNLLPVTCLSDYDGTSTLIANSDVESSSKDMRAQSSGACPCDSSSIVWYLKPSVASWMQRHYPSRIPVESEPHCPNFNSRSTCEDHASGVRKDSLQNPIQLWRNLYIAASRLQEEAYSWGDSPRRLQSSKTAFSMQRACSAIAVEPYIAKAPMKNDDAKRPTWATFLTAMRRIFGSNCCIGPL